MNCKTTENYLSAYIDGELEETMRQNVAAHISECPRCQAKADELKAAAKQLSKAPKVSAPADFTKRLYDRLEQPPLWERLLNRLFKPFHIKIPLELATAAALGVLVVFVMLPAVQEQSVVTDGQMAKAPRPIAETRSPDLEGIKMYSQAPEPREARSEKEADEKVITVAWLVRPRAVAPPFEAGERRRPATDREKSAAAEPETKPRKMAEKSTGGAVESRETSDSIAYSLSVAAPSRREQSIDHLKKVVKAINGRMLSINKDAAGQPESVRVELPAALYSAFIRRLSMTGDFETPPPDISPKNKQPIELVIHIPDSL